MATDIFIANTDEEILSCFPAFSVLRPHIRETDFLPRVRRQQAQSYRIVAVRSEGVVESAAGFRLAEFLVSGKVLYIDDLTTLPCARSLGHAGELMDWLIGHAREHGCNGVHLDTGYGRHAAHRLYLRKGLQFSAHHLSLGLGNA